MTFSVSKSDGRRKAPDLPGGVNEAARARRSQRTTPPSDTYRNNYDQIKWRTQPCRGQ